MSIVSNTSDSPSDTPLEVPPDNQAYALVPAEGAEDVAPPLPVLVGSTWQSIDLLDLNATNRSRFVLGAGGDVDGTQAPIVPEPVPEPRASRQPFSVGRQPSCASRLHTSTALPSRAERSWMR